MDATSHNLMAPCMPVIPVAGHNSLLLNLGGAHAPFLRRNLGVSSDCSGQCLTPGWSFQPKSPCPVR